MLDGDDEDDDVIVDREATDKSAASAGHKQKRQKTNDVIDL